MASASAIMNESDDDLQSVRRAAAGDAAAAKRYLRALNRLKDVLPALQGAPDGNRRRPGRST